MRTAEVINIGDGSLSSWGRISTMTHSFLCSRCWGSKLQTGKAGKRWQTTNLSEMALKWLLFWAVVMEGGFSPTAPVLLGHVVCYSEWARGSFQIVQAAVFEEVLSNYTLAWRTWQPIVLAPASCWYPDVPCNPKWALGHTLLWQPLLLHRALTTYWTLGCPEGNVPLKQGLIKPSAECVTDRQFCFFFRS